MVNLVILLGPPGSGKGAQGQRIASSLGFTRIVMGDLVRRSSLDVSGGKYLSDELVSKILLDEIKNNEGVKDFVLDGYPRTLEQCNFLEENLKDKNTLVFCFQINYDLLAKRILGRFVCKSCNAVYNRWFLPTKEPNACDNCLSNDFITRSDDSLETLKIRLNEFDISNAKVLNFYFTKSLNIKYIDASKSFDDVYAQISSECKNFFVQR